MNTGIITLYEVQFKLIRFNSCWMKASLRQDLYRISRGIGLYSYPMRLSKAMFLRNLSFPLPVYVLEIGWCPFPSRLYRWLGKLIRWHGFCCFVWESISILAPRFWCSWVDKFRVEWVVDRRYCVGSWERYCHFICVLVCMQLISSCLYIYVDLLIYLPTNIHPSIHSTPK